MEAVKKFGIMLSIIAGIVASLAKIGERGEAALATAIEIFVATGAAAIWYTVFVSWFVPFFYFNNKFVALLSSIAIFVGEGFIVITIFGNLSFEQMARRGLTPLETVVYGTVGILICVSGLHYLAKKYQVL
jgi:hypothetical protein